MIDAAVVGGGPAGSLAARMLARAGRDVVVLEEHPEPGSPVQCTGLVSPRTVEMSGVRPDVLNALYGAVVRFPGGGELRLSSGEPKALLLDRRSLDVRMAEAAQDAGAEYRFGERYISHSVGGCASVRTSAGGLDARLLVGADGCGSAVAASLPRNGPKEYIRGVQADVRFEMEDQRTIDIRIGSARAPGFFTWMVPFGGLTRIGLCTSWSAGPPFPYLKRLIAEAGAEGCEVVARSCGRIPLGGRRRTYGERLLLIGDAAGQVKPVSGGGLHPAFASCAALADAAEAAFESGDFSARRLSAYERGWKRAVGRELRRGYRLRRMYCRLSDADFDRVLSAVGGGRARAALEAADIDRPSDAVALALRDIPAALRLLPVALKALI